MCCAAGQLLRFNFRKALANIVIIPQDIYCFPFQLPVIFFQPFPAGILSLFRAIFCAYSCKSCYIVQRVCILFAFYQENSIRAGSAADIKPVRASVMRHFIAAFCIGICLYPAESFLSFSIIKAHFCQAIPVRAIAIRVFSSKAQAICAGNPVNKAGPLPGFRVCAQILFITSQSSTDIINAAAGMAIKQDIPCAFIIGHR